MSKRHHLEDIAKQFGQDIADDFLRISEAYRQKAWPDPMEPPWQVFPDYERSSIGWRMGNGEDYMIDFDRWFRTQDVQAQDSYILQFPEPEGWEGFYDNRRRR